MTDANASYNMPAGQHRRITLTLNVAARKLLKRFKRLPATLALNGKPVSTVAFKVKKKTKHPKH